MMSHHHHHLASLACRLNQASSSSNQSREKGLCWRWRGHQVMRCCVSLSWCHYHSVAVAAKWRGASWLICDETIKWISTVGLFSAAPSYWIELLRLLLLLLLLRLHLFQRKWRRRKLLIVFNFNIQVVRLRISHHQKMACGTRVLQW